MRSQVLRFGVIGVLLLGSACEYVERRRAPAEETAQASGVALSLEAPGVIRIGEEGTVRLSVTNRGDSIASGVRAELLIPGWMEPVLPEPSGREVTMVSTPEEETRLSYRLDEPPLQPGETQTITQRIRAPLTGPIAQGAMPWGRTVRARLVRADGEPLGAEVESELVIDTTGMAEHRLADSLRGDTLRRGAGDTAVVRRDRVGPVRLGMTASALRQAANGARDTTWTREGTQERGLVVPLENQQRVTAQLVGDTVTRIYVHDPGVRTPEGLGGGSRLEELRNAYGRGCADVGEGVVVVWFEGAPGITFALDTRPPQNAAQIRDDPERIPGSATVRHLWVRRTDVPCPQPGTRQAPASPRGEAEAALRISPPGAVDLWLAYVPTDREEHPS